MFFLFNSDDDVSWVTVRLLVRLAFKYVLLAVRNTSVQADFNTFLFAQNLLEFAFLATLAFGHNGAFSPALVTVGGGLGYHAWAELNNASNHSAAFAVVTLGSSLSAGAFAVRTDFEAFNSKFLGLACEDFFEGHLHFVVVVLGLLFAVVLTLAAASHEHAHEVVHASTAASVATHDGFFSTHVLELALLGVGQHVVGLRNLLEQIFVSAAIRMVLQC